MGNTFFTFCGSPFNEPLTEEVVLDRLGWSSFSTYRIEYRGILRVHICLIAGGREMQKKVVTAFH